MKNVKIKKKIINISYEEKFNKNLKIQFKYLNFLWL